MNADIKNEVLMAIYQITDLAGYICDNDGTGERTLSFAQIIEEKAKWCADTIDSNLSPPE